MVMYVVHYTFTKYSYGRVLGLSDNGLVHILMLRPSIRRKITFKTYL